MNALALIGCGQLFESIVASWPTLAQKQRELHILRLNSTDHLAEDTALALAQLDPKEVRIFAAIDHQALNHARLDVYGRARLLGFRSETLIHPQAIVAANITLGENCWVGPGAIIDANVQVANNSVINAGGRIDHAAKIGANVWIGAGAAIGAQANIGMHCVIGADVKLAAGITLGRHCSINIPGSYADSLEQGTLIDMLFSNPVHIYGMRSGAKA
jgi:acetyltransferase-like isoleucine patch superfamily enzyme